MEALEVLETMEVLEVLALQSQPTASCFRAGSNSPLRKQNLDEIDVKGKLFYPGYSATVPAIWEGGECCVFCSALIIDLGRTVHAQIVEVHRDKKTYGTSAFHLPNGILSKNKCYIKLDRC